MLKIIELDIDSALSADTGVFEVAFVESPAIEQEFIYFKEEKFYKATDEISNVACQAIKENEKRGNPAATQVGKVRAQQLCNKEEISLETVKRMYSYLSRAKVYNTDNWDDNGTISWKLWGGQPALDWAERIVEKEKEEDFEIDPNPCWEGYEPYGLKPGKGGELVPNCIPVKNSKENFVDPIQGETKDGYVSRCIAYLIKNEGYSQDQAAAICYSKSEEKFARSKVSFDYDGTLTTDKGKYILENEYKRGSEIYLITARTSIPDALINLARKYSIPSSRIFATGSNQNKIQKIKDLGIEKHYDDNLRVRELLGPIAQRFDYDISQLPAYDNYPASGDTDAMLVKPFLDNFEEVEIDIFGFEPEHFDMCPGAVNLFTHLSENKIDEEFATLVRRAAVFADELFKLEKITLLRGYSTVEDLMTAKDLVSAFKIVIASIDEIMLMKHDVSFIDGHLKVITDYFDPTQEFAPYPWDECISDQKKRGYSNEVSAKICGKIKAENMSKIKTKYDEYSLEEIEAYELLMELKKTDKLKFEETIVELQNGLSETDLLNANFKRQRVFYKYRVSNITPTKTTDSRDFCVEREDRYFSRMVIDTMKDLNREFGHGDGGGSYSKWLYKGGPNCVHSWERFTVKGSNIQNMGLVAGTPGTAPIDMQYNGYYSEESRARSKKAYAISQQNMTSINSKLLSFSEEKRMVYTPLMIPNILIPRKDENDEIYWVKFSPETIEKIQQKFMIEQRTRDTNLEHTDKKFKDIVMVESWIVSSSQDKAYSFGYTEEQIPIGTWMAGYKVLETPQGNEIWDKYIKPGKVKGASVEGNFILNFSTQNSDEYLLEEIINILKQII